MVSVMHVNAATHYVIFRQKSYEIYTVAAVDDVFIPAPRDVIVSLQSRGELLIRFLE